MDLSYTVQDEALESQVHSSESVWFKQFSYVALEILIHLFFQMVFVIEQILKRFRILGPYMAFYVVVVVLFFYCSEYFSGWFYELIYIMIFSIKIYLHYTVRFLSECLSVLFYCVQLLRSRKISKKILILVCWLKFEFKWLELW